ncbi:MAG: hypothetical protein RIR76_3252 [Verrucomicrobiota bacterium]|jgi:hypothetical protein
MKSSPALHVLCIAILASAGCTSVRPVTSPPAPPREPLAPSPRLIVGRIIAVDQERRFAFVELAGDAPPAALTEGGELLVRSLAELRETARLAVSRHVRGRTLGTSIAKGRPVVGEEVVWVAP